MDITRDARNEFSISSSEIYDMDAFTCPFLFIIGLQFRIQSECAVSVCRRWDGTTGDPQRFKTVQHNRWRSQ
jgi:hypothetical protein